MKTARTASRPETERAHLEVKRHVRPDDGHAFVPDPVDDGREAHLHKTDVANDFAEELGEEFVTAATGNVDVGEQQATQTSPAESGGPYLVVPAAREMVDDDSEPEDSEAEAFPTAMRAGSTPPPQRTGRRR